MKPFINNNTQNITNPLSWIASVCLHFCVFFVLLNTPIAREHANHSAFVTINLINETTSQTRLLQNTVSDETVAKLSEPDDKNNDLLPYYPTHPPSQENMFLKQLEKKISVSAQTNLLYNNQSNNQLKIVRSSLPKSKPTKPAVPNKTKLKRIDRPFNNMKFKSKNGEKIISKDPLTGKHSERKTLMALFGQTTNKKPTDKPSTNVPTRNIFDNKAEIKKIGKVKTLPSVDNLALSKNSAISPLLELLPPRESNLNQVRTTNPQKVDQQNKKILNKPTIDRPDGTVVTKDKHENAIKKTKPLSNKTISNPQKDERSATLTADITSPLSNDKIFAKKSNNREKKIAFTQRDKNLVSNVKMRPNKNLLKTWGTSVRNDIVRRTLGSKLGRDVKVVLKISKTGKLLTLKIIGTPNIDKSVEKFITTIKTSGDFPKAPAGLTLDYVNFPINFLSSG